MTDQILVSLRDLAQKTEATIPQLKYWLKLLGFLTIVRSRTAYVTQDQADLLSQIAAMIQGGMAPSDAVAKVAPEPVSTAMVVRSDDPIIPTTHSLENIENAMMEMARTFGEGMNALRQEIRDLRQENHDLRSRMIRLLPPADPPPQVIPWHPEPARDPLAGKSWWEQAWVRFAHPERCRRSEN